MDTAATIEALPGAPLNPWIIRLADGSTLGGRFESYATARRAFDRFGLIPGGR